MIHHHEFTVAGRAREVFRIKVWHDARSTEDYALKTTNHSTYEAALQAGLELMAKDSHVVEFAIEKMYRRETL